jgi:hypothetical protein
MVNGIQHTVAWHVDDVKSSVVNPTVNDEIIARLDEIYGSDITGHIKLLEGVPEDYWALNVKVSMTKYVQTMIHTFPENIGNQRSTHHCRKGFAKLTTITRSSMMRKNPFSIRLPQREFSLTNGPDQISNQQLPTYPPESRIQMIKIGKAQTVETQVKRQMDY